MAQNIMTSNLEKFNISNGTNKLCHLCMGEFSSVPALHEHIDNDHDFRHPTTWSQSNFNAAILKQIQVKIQNKI